MWGYFSLFLLVLVALSIWIIYNRLVTARETVNEALAGIDVQLKKRFELIPSLVEMVKGYSDYEANTFEQLTQMREQDKTITDNPDLRQREKEDAGLNVISQSIKITAEDYPELKASDNFIKLMEALTKVEKELAMSRRYLNGTIRDYNTKIGVFPNVLIAGSFGFDERPFYEIEAFEREPQKIFE